jgi:hypothetical protein
MMGPLGIAFCSLCIVLASMLAHELGHALMVRRLGKKETSRWRTWTLELEFDVSGLSPEEVKSIYYGGIILGAVPLFSFFALPLAIGVPLFIMALILHLHFCIYDIRRLRMLPGDDLRAALLFITPLGLLSLIAGVIILSYLSYGGA